jgi:hypothetical protein
VLLCYRIRGAQVSLQLVFVRLLPRVARALPHGAGPESLLQMHTGMAFHLELCLQAL